MELYDIAKTQKLIAENKTDKEISERLYELCKHIVKELAEGYQIIENVFQNLVNDMESLHMPHKPNPFQSWHEVNQEPKKKDDKISNSNSPNAMMKYFKSAKKITKAVKLISSARSMKDKLKSLQSRASNKAATGSTKKVERVINESLQRYQD